jgi:hypothetical protein
MFATTKYTPFTTLSIATRYFCNSKSGYRFRFNGQEQDNEIAGTGNIMTAEFWMYDGRLGRRWNVDPIEYPWQSGYTTFNNNPNFFNDPLGLEGEKPNKESESTDKTYQSTDKKGESAIDYVKPNSENKNPPSLLYRIINSLKRHHTGPKGKWVKDRNYTELPGTYNSDNNTFSYTALADQSTRIISYKILNDPQSHVHLTNFSFWSLSGYRQNTRYSQRTVHLNWGGHIPITPFDFKDGGHLAVYSGIGYSVAVIGAAMMILSNYGLVLGRTEGYAMQMMTGAAIGSRMNPLYGDLTHFKIKVYSNQPIQLGDIRMLVKYKRLIPYSDLTEQQKGFIRKWYYGY